MTIKYPVLLTSLLLSVSLAAPSAVADHRDHRHSHYDARYSNNGFITARVIDVEPVYQRLSGRDYRYDERVRTCYSEPSRYDASDRRKKALIGGVVGGLIGYQVGDKQRHKNAGAVAGALIGATVAKRSDNDHVRCETHYEPRYSQRTRIVGYDVVYKYRGRHYTTFSEYDPGRWIEVKRPVKYRRH